MSIWMEPSPKGRSIIEVEGDAEQISARGADITELGGKMRSSAELLETIKTRSSDQQGKAIDTLRDRIGSSYETLFEAADLYEPVGPVIQAYGDALAIVKPKIDGHASTCGELWLAYVALPGAVEPRGTGGWFEPDEGSPEADRQAEEDAAKKRAYDAFVDEAELFDVDYDTWEDAFDTAVRGISDGMAGSIEDGFWRSFLDIAGKVLGWVGLVVGIAALIIGGPILGAIALVVGVLALVVVIAQAAMGDKNGWDIALAVVSILPIGKLGKLGKLAQGRYADFADDALKSFKNLGKLKTAPREMDGLVDVFKTKGASEGFKKLLTGSTSQDNAERALGYMLGGDIGPMSWKVLHNIDTVSTIIGNGLKFEGWLSKTTPYPGVGSVPGLGPTLKVLF